MNKVLEVCLSSDLGGLKLHVAGVSNASAYPCAVCKTIKPNSARVLSEPLMGL